MSQSRVLIVILLIALIVFGVELIITKQLPLRQQSTAISTSLPQIAQAAWSTCVNSYGEYSFQYPSNWHVFKPWEGGPLETDCEDAGANFSINSTDPYATSSRGEDYNTGSMDFSFIKGTELKSIPNSLDDFFAQRPAILQANKVLMTGTVGGEKAVWVQEPHDFLDIYLWHNGNIIIIGADKLNNTGVLNEVLTSFKFG